MKLYLLLIFFAIGVLIIGLCIPLIRRKIKPNRFYGFKTPKTLSDPDIWYPVNVYSGKWGLVMGSAMILVGSILYPFESIDEVSYGLIVGGLTFLMGILMVVLSVLYLRRIVREKEGDGK